MSEPDPASDPLYHKATDRARLSGALDIAGAGWAQPVNPNIIRLMPILDTGGEVKNRARYVLELAQHRA